MVCMRPSASHVIPVYRQGGTAASAPQPLRLLADWNSGQLVVANRRPSSVASAGASKDAAGELS